MEYRRLGRAGVRVSAISLGSWLTYGGAVEDRTAIACIHRAYDLGINFFDTANQYRRGGAEEVVGQAHRCLAAPAGGRERPCRRHHAAQ
jgi:aryl-alcohol dehydrogenase-like predicted oxidoreductase